MCWWSGNAVPRPLAILDGLKGRGAAFRSLTKVIDTTTPHGELLYAQRLVRRVTGAGGGELTSDNAVLLDLTQARQPQHPSAGVTRDNLSNFLQTYRRASG